MYKKHNQNSCRITYYFLFAARYRRRVFDVPGAADAVIKGIKESGAKEGSVLEGCRFWTIICNDCYCMVGVEAHTGLSPDMIFNGLKGAAFGALMNVRQYKNMCQTVWTREYLVSTIPFEETEVRGFLSSQISRPKEKGGKE